MRCAAGATSSATVASKTTPAYMEWAEAKIFPAVL
jgi:hypothetical protein